MTELTGVIVDLLLTATTSLDGRAIRYRKPWTMAAISILTVPRRASTLKLQRNTMHAN